jgi:hypothetical protein
MTTHSTRRYSPVENATPTESDFTLTSKPTDDIAATAASRKALKAAKLAKMKAEKEARLTESEGAMQTHDSHQTQYEDEDD